MIPWGHGFYASAPRRTSLELCPPRPCPQPCGTACLPDPRATRGKAGAAAEAEEHFLEEILPGGVMLQAVLKAVSMNRAERAAPR